MSDVPEWRQKKKKTERVKRVLLEERDEETPFQEMKGRSRRTK